MSVVLCLPAHLRVCTAASRGQAPHRERVKRVSPPRGYPSLACHSGPPTPSSAAQQLAARSSQRSAAARSDARQQRRDREGSAGSRTPSSTSSIGRPARSHSQLQQPLPQPPADQHRPHSQSSATSPTSTTTPGPLHREERWWIRLRRARRGRSPTPMRRAYCVGCCGGSNTATAIPGAKAACPGASSSARTWARTACGQWRSGCGREGMSTASATSAGGPGPGRTNPAKGCAPTGLRRTRTPTSTRRAPRSMSPCGT